MYAIIDNQYYNDENSIQVTVMQIVQGKRTPHTHTSISYVGIYLRESYAFDLCVITSGNNRHGGGLCSFILARGKSM